MPRFDAVRRFTVVLAAVLIASSVHAQQQGQIFISMLDAQGHPVNELTASEVTVTADGQDCKVLKVEPVSKPTRLVLMIDNGTMISKDIGGLRLAYKALIEAVPDGIPTELITTSPQARWLEKVTTDRQKLLQALERLSPDSGNGAFFDALAEAGGRVEKEKGAYLPVIVMLAADSNRNDSVLDWRFEKLQKQVIQYGITVHFVLFRAGAVGVGQQFEMGQALTKLSGGRFETISLMSRLATLLPEFAKTLAASDLRQTNQFLVTYERAKGSKPAQQVSAGLRNKPGVALELSFDGRMPGSGR